MKILVTGSSGHLGEALVRALKSGNHEVIGIDRLPSLFTNGVGSITDRDFVRTYMKEVQTVLHTATLHKPHVTSHNRQQFIDTNITGTLNLLEESVENNVQSFIYTSTTSTFGDALTPDPGSPAAWITELVTPIPKNIYGVTKMAGEDLCQLFHRNEGLACMVLKTSRFFPEVDDQQLVRDYYGDMNAKVNEFLYRRVDIEDVVNAHLLAIEKAGSIGFGRYIISADTPFSKSDLPELFLDAPGVVKRLIPGYETVYLQKGWKMFPLIDRVYVNEKAKKDLGWRPANDFQRILEKLKENEYPYSQLTKIIGSKGYHRL
jgi:nucleoside-diphosphate-sugar epimerase